MKGSCLCGAVAFEIDGPVRAPLACHCTQCRKNTGHYASLIRVAKSDLKMTASQGLKWFNSSDIARRGFCSTCGSSVFWERKGTENMSIHAGVIDGDLGQKTTGHIAVANKGDYYEICDGLPQKEGF